MRREDFGQLYPLRGRTCEQRGDATSGTDTPRAQVDRILDDENIKAAIHAVKSNKGAAGIDKMTVDALDVYMAMHCLCPQGRGKLSNKSLRSSTNRSR